MSVLCGGIKILLTELLAQRACGAAGDSDLHSRFYVFFFFLFFLFYHIKKRGETQAIILLAQTLRALSFTLKHRKHESFSPLHRPSACFFRESSFVEKEREKKRTVL